MRYFLQSNISANSDQSFSFSLGHRPRLRADMIDTVRAGCRRACNVADFIIVAGKLSERPADPANL
jgi:hypothetical protein